MCVRMLVCACVCVFVYVLVCMFLCVCFGLYGSVAMCTACLCVYGYECLWLCAYDGMCVFVFVRVSVGMRVWDAMFLFVCVAMRTCMCFSVYDGVYKLEI